MRSRVRQGIVAVSTVAVATLLGVGTSAIASTGGGAELPEGFLAEKDVDQAWVSKYNSMLDQFPPGTKAAVNAPAFFHPSEPGEHMFEAGLIDELMVQTQRCAWIREGIAAGKASDARRAERAEEMLSKPSQLQKRDANGETFGDYLAEGARAAGTDIRTFELTVECDGGYGRDR